MEGANHKRHKSSDDETGAIPKDCTVPRYPGREELFLPPPQITTEDPSVIGRSSSVRVSRPGGGPKLPSCTLSHATISMWLDWWGPEP